MAEVLIEPASAAASGPIPAYDNTSPGFCHRRRVAYAQNWLRSMPDMTPREAVLISSSNVSGVVIVGSVIDREPACTPTPCVQPPPKWDSSVADSALAQAYRVHMNTFAGCPTNP